MLRMTPSFYVGKLVGGVFKGDTNSVEEDMEWGEEEEFQWDPWSWNFPMNLS